MVYFGDAVKWEFRNAEYGFSLSEAMLSRYPMKAELMKALGWHDPDIVKLEYDATYSTLMLTDIENQYKVKATLVK